MDSSWIASREEHITPPKSATQALGRSAAPDPVYNRGCCPNGGQISNVLPSTWIDFGTGDSCLYHVYVRGEAYLAAGQGSAAAEFQKIIEHSGLVANCWTGALAHLGVARANALQSRTSQGADADAARTRALAAYKNSSPSGKTPTPTSQSINKRKRSTQSCSSCEDGCGIIFVDSAAEQKILN